MALLYGINLSPYVRKVRVFLAEKGIAYDQEPVIPVNVSDEYKKISPLGKIPAYRDGDKIINDSSVICAYLERTNPKPSLYPSDPYEFARALWFEEYGDNGLNLIGAKIFFPVVVAPAFFKQPQDMESARKAFEEELPTFFDYLESQLGDADTLAGNTFSIGDIGICSHFVNLHHSGFRVDSNRWPKLARYVDAIHSRPSFKAIIEEETASLKAS